MGTENHNYNTPAKGTTDWHLPINKNSERLDTDVEIRDTDANKSNYTPKQGAKFVATDTGTVYLGDGNNWTKFGSYNSDVETVFASKYPGGDLATKLENAINDLPGGQGRIRITPPEDGSHWTWSSDVRVDLENYEGLHIDVGRNVRIDYSGSGTLLTVDGIQNSFDVKKALTLTGGVWVATGDPNGWVKLQDASFSQIHPRQVDFRNGSGDAYGVRLENNAKFNEEVHISGHYVVDIGVDTVPPESGESGTNSFHGCSIENAAIIATNIGVRWRGNPNFTTMHNVTLQSDGDGVDLLVLDGSPMKGAAYTGVKFENANKVSNPTGIVVGPNYDGYDAPFLTGLSFGGNIANSERYRDDGAGNAWVPYMQFEGGGPKIKELSSGNTVFFNVANSIINHFTATTKWDDGNGEGMEIAGSGYHSIVGPFGNGTMKFQSNEDSDMLRIQGDSDGVEIATKANYDPQSAAPSGASNGDIAYADGTNWDPGSGEGFYGYEAGSWTKL